MCSPKKVCCFVCYNFFSKDIKSDKCKVCGDFKCPICKGCLCNLTVGEKRVAMAMIKTYEKTLNNNYNFAQHKKIELEIKRSLTPNK
jgi:hypothetical protein